MTHLVFMLLFNRLHKVNVTELDDGKSGMRNDEVCLRAILSNVITSRQIHCHQSIDLALLRILHMPIVQD